MASGSNKTLFILCFGLWIGSTSSAYGKEERVYISLKKMFEVYIEGFAKSDSLKIRSVSSSHYMNSVGGMSKLQKKLIQNKESFKQYKLKKVIYHRTPKGKLYANISIQNGDEFIPMDMNSWFLITEKDKKFFILRKENDYNPLSLK